jgi:cytochrome c
MNRLHQWAMGAIGLAALSMPTWAQTGDPARGERVYRACVACHSLERDRHMTGPSLAELWNRKAGGLASFDRYSPALKSSGVVWDDRSIDAWLKDPLHFIPGNTMTFAGIKDEQPRADLLAFLKEATQPGSARTAQSGRDQMGPGGMRGRGGMMGMMGGGNVPNLKNVEPGQRVTRIRLCKDTYRIATADGNTRDFWERNLRFKTDSSRDGPEKGAPAILRAGMMGDRAAVIFATPDEVSAFISVEC